MVQAVLNQFQDDRRPCLQFRRGDDDAIAVDYVAKLRQTAEDRRAYLVRHRRLTIDFNHGFIDQPDAKGFQAKPIFKPLWGVTLATAVMPEVRQTVMNFQQNKMAQFMPRMTWSDPDMFVRCHGDIKDSYEKIPTKRRTRRSALSAAVRH